MTSSFEIDKETQRKLKRAQELLWQTLFYIPSCTKLYSEVVAFRYKGLSEAALAEEIQEVLEETHALKRVVKKFGGEYGTDDFAYPLPNTSHTKPWDPSLQVTETYG